MADGDKTIVEEEVVAVGEELTDKATCEFCNDPFRVGECPQHPSEKKEKYPEAPTPEAVTITAADRVEPTKISVWHGFVYKCPACSEPSIMHFGEFGFASCPACRAIVNYAWEADNKH